MKKYKLPRSRVRLVREKALIYRARTPEDVVPIVRAVCCDERGDREVMVAIYLDGRSRAVHHEIVAIGTRNALLTTPAEVLRGAIIGGAQGIILGHNHPSGSTTPSAEDISMTKAIERAGELVGIQLLDHIIVTETESFSFLENGLLPSGARP